MIYIATQSWVWMLLSALVGFAMGWVSVIQRSYALTDPTMKKCGAALAAIVLVSLFHLIPGRAGYWLDLALVMLVFYLAGCMIGSWLRMQVVARMAPPA